MKVYIVNLGKYNEGDRVGAWFSFPLDYEHVKERIGLNEQYEEYAVHDWENIPWEISQYMNIEELNTAYAMIAQLEDTPHLLNDLNALIGLVGTLEEIVEYKDAIRFYTGTDVSELAEKVLISEGTFYGVDSFFIKHFNFSSYGNELVQSGKFVQTAKGFYSSI